MRKAGRSGRRSRRAAANSGPSGSIRPRTGGRGVGRDTPVPDSAGTDEEGRTLRTKSEESGRQLRAKWFYSAADERRTFRIRYRVTGGITTYPDAPDLSWQC